MGARKAQVSDFTLAKFAENIQECGFAATDRNLLGRLALVDAAVDLATSTRSMILAT
jgi:hypothetical protein